MDLLISIRSNYIVNCHNYLILTYGIYNYYLFGPNITTRKNDESKYPTNISVRTLAKWFNEVQIDIVYG